MVWTIAFSLVYSSLAKSGIFSGVSLAAYLPPAHSYGLARGFRQVQKNF